MATHPAQRAGSQVNGKWLAWPRTVTWFRENVMFSVYIDKVGDMAVLQCEGRIVRSEAAFELREVVTSQRDARVVFIDLSEVNALEGGGLGMLIFLQRWAQDHNIQLKLFNPSQSLRARLEHASSMSEFEPATVDEMMALLAHTEHPYALAS